ncbi:hypothetical protein C494_07370 [Natronorubrum bangense JCM 10635]|uniref:Uncharacterized protein n=1 Tax=Natronorubrum bangense JCM 10635 TaxID=1227500 RepID=L9WN92_9EURY|nr:hypothetical protein C494_07370 [Natronorubrum bangense JCM 10635]
MKRTFRVDAAVSMLFRFTDTESLAGCCLLAGDGESALCEFWSWLELHTSIATSRYGVGFVLEM